MKERIGDLWDHYPGRVLRCVTTNGVVKRNGELVMGAGVARQAAQRHPRLPSILGRLVQERGNHVHVVDDLASFPTKHHWKQPSDLNLIIRSARELVYEARNFDSVVMTRPGCGLGRLKWEDVRPWLENLFDDRFLVVHQT